MAINTRHFAGPDLSVISSMPLLSPHPALAAAIADLTARFDARLLCRLRTGSHAYGLAGPHSDEDERGIFIVPSIHYAALNELPKQISDAKSDHVYYSVQRVFELLAEANPSMVELIYTPADCVLACDPTIRQLFDARAQLLTQSLVRAKIGYAMGQIKKARGQKKWINQPQPETPPSAEQFCFWIPSAELAPEAMPARPRPIAELPVPLAHCHVARVEHGGHLFRLYRIGAEARGVFRGGGLPVCVSVNKEIERSHYLGLLMFNEQGFQRAKLDHHNYWRWRTERNDARWIAQESGQLDYDAKNLMHCMRLLFSARQMLDGGEPLVRVSGAVRSELLDIRAGKFSYPELIERADALVNSCEADLLDSTLPKEVDQQALNALCLRVNEASSVLYNN
jgi:uncharacterized protein